MAHAIAGALSTTEVARITGCGAYASCGRTRLVRNDLPVPRGYAALLYEFDAGLQIR